MTWKDASILAVIPARGASKSIPRKNLAKIGGLSLIAHAARVVTSLDWVDAAIISTDDEEICAEAVRNGLDAPFMRPAHLADDKANSIDMWKHAWIEAENAYGRRFDLSILVEPTSPMRKPEDLSNTVEALIENNAPSAATLSITPAHYSPHKTLTVNASGRIEFYLEDGVKYARRQDIPTYYHRNGLCYAVTRQTLLEDGKLMDEDCAAVIVDRPVVNIDEPIDLAFAEFLMTYRETT